MWLITNNKVEINDTKLQAVYSNGNILYYSDSSVFKDNLNNIWIVQGEYFLRKSCVTSNKSNLLFTLFAEFGDEFIQFIKGNFIIIRIYNNGFKIYSDRFALRKFFIWNSEDVFIISDNLSLISKKVSLTASPESIAIYSLTYHFTGGTTLFKNVRHNSPGETIDFKDNKLNFGKYWQPEQLLELPKRKVKIEEIVEKLSDSIDQYLEKDNSNKLSLSLTGGSDTRNLLGLLLSKGLNPHLYTYGNPNSNDCIIASVIAKGLKLEHNIHNIALDSKLFENIAREIIRMAGGLASIHRVHRLLAIQQESSYASTMFLGNLGGEFVRGVSEDDYIIPSIVYENWAAEEISIENLKNYLNVKRVNISNVDINNIFNILSKEPYLNGNQVTRKHCALSYITAHLHDAQDINLYSTVMDRVFVPFLDIDYLELLFSSSFSFDNKQLYSSKFRKRIDNPVYSANFLNSTFKPLLSYKYAGYHKPSEVLFNKYYAAAIKFLRQKTSKQLPPNFPLGFWMEEFVKDNLTQCKDYTVLRETFLLDDLISDFQTGKHVPKEAYWLKFTTPIMMRFLIEEYNAE